MAKNSPAKLIIADSERDPDMLYATRFFVPDAFLFLEVEGRRTIALSDLEVDRGRVQAKVDEVVSISAESERLALAKKATFGDFAAAFLKDRKVRRAEVPANFPLAFALTLEKAGIRLTPAKGLFWPEREFKEEAELKLMRKALQITEIGIARGLDVLRAAELGKAVRGRTPLRFGNAALTSERLRAEIDSAVLHAGGLPANTIVAGGELACDPHERGSGPLHAHELIIIDVFPRDARTGYYGDCTRTVVRGQATDAQRKLWETVRGGQAHALRRMKPGVPGIQIHEEIREIFREVGFPTEQHEGRWRGFFHGTGHGLGLEIHESPRFGATTFQPGQVITVEPGIYWPGVGGARIEDVAAITTTGVKNLSKLPKVLEV